MESDVDGEEKDLGYVEMCVKAMKATEVRNRLEIWEVPEELPRIHTSQPHIIHVLNIYFGE